MGLAALTIAAKAVPRVEISTSDKRPEIVHQFMVMVSSLLIGRVGIDVSVQLGRGVM